MTEKLAPFPMICPHCHAAAKYEVWRTLEEGVHLYGLTTWECGWAFHRWKEDPSGAIREAATSECRRRI